MPPINTNIPAFVSEDGDANFLPGVDSNSDPAQLTPGKYARSMNTVNRGGVVQCRPGYRCKVAYPDGNLQGGEYFFPKAGLPILLVVVEGILYRSDSPYTEYSEVPGVLLSSVARQVFFKQVEQSIVFNQDGSLSFIEPRNLMIIQDGAFSPPIIFDGTRAEQIRGAGNIPLGGMMEWVGDRLWVARDNKVFASDLANPLSFREPQYVTTVSAFIFSGNVTALTKTPSLLSPQLLVYTEFTTAVLLASIRDRSLWISTPDFQKTIFPNIGCTSTRSVAVHFGLLWWWSSYGLTNFDAASQAAQTSAFPYRDAEMQDSKSRLSEDTAGICVASVENYFLVSVPSSSLWNTETWCLDTAAFQTLRDQAPPSWNSLWTGTRPICWLTAAVNDTNLIMYLSKDEDGVNRLWEAFTPDRLDEYCPITWYLETRGYFIRDPLGLKQFRFADIFLSELAGTVDVAVFWAGSSRGKYKRILTKRIEATVGIIRAEDTITGDEILYALKKQSRAIRTQDGKEIINEDTQQSCEVESTDMEFIDDAFQLLIVVSGPGAVRGVLIYTHPVEGQKLGGDCSPDETDVRAVRYDGAAGHGTNYQDVTTLLAEDEIVFHSTRTVTMTVGEFTEIGTGWAESVISQEDADKIAECIARRKASKSLEAVLPSVVSLGDE